MSNTQHPEALMLADDLDGDWTTIKHMRDAAAELRRQQARIAELEEQLSAIGAGGVEPLRKKAATQADALIALNSLTRYTVGRCGNGPMRTFAHPGGPYLRYTEFEAAMAAMKPRVWTAEKAQEELAEASAQADAKDAKDAVRYRWLRDNDWRNDEKMEPVIRLHLNAIWDEKIDAAMAAQARNKKGTK